MIANIDTEIGGYHRKFNLINTIETNLSLKVNWLAISEIQWAIFR